MNGERKKIVYNIFLFHMINKCGESSPTSLFHKGITFLRVCVCVVFFRLCVRFIYIFINNIRGVITVDEIYGCDNSQHYTFDWHCMRLIKWISTLTHTCTLGRSLCWCEIFSVWSHSFSFGFHSILKISRIVPMFVSVCALHVCVSSSVRGKRLFLLNHRHKLTHTCSQSQSRPLSPWCWHFDF